LKKSEQQVLSLTAFVLIIVTVSAVYTYNTDPQTQENIKLSGIKQKLNAPINAEFLGIKQYQLLDHSITVYTWRQENTLYEAQLNEQESIIKTTTYQHYTNDTNITMTPALAETLAQQKLISMTQYPPGHPNLSEPKFEYYTFRSQGPNWVVQWKLHSGNYTISNIGFEVLVFTETGETSVNSNKFNEVTQIPEYAPPKISHIEAEQLAADYFKESMEYTTVKSTRAQGVQISPPDDIFIQPPYRLYWSVIVSGIGMEDGVPDSRRPVFHIDAYTGELLSSYYISIGWETINWMRSSYPYYGSVYPKIVDKTSRDFDFPFSSEEVKEMVLNHSALYRVNSDGSLRIRVKDEVSISNDLSWDTIILGTIENKPVVASYWTASYNWIKTGLINPPNSIQDLINADVLIDGFIIIVDPITGELLHFFNSTRNSLPSNTLIITREQAVNITATSPLADLENKIIKQDSIVYAEPRIIKTDWNSQLANVGDFRRLYIADVNQTGARIYWIIEYSNVPEAHGGFTGVYLVDAETGQVALALEDYPLPDLLFRGYGPEQIYLRRGETFSFNITVEAASTLEAVLPVTLSVDQIPKGVTVIIKRDILQLSNQKIATFNVTLIASPDAVSGIYNAYFKIRLLGRGTSVHPILEIIE